MRDNLWAASGFNPEQAAVQLDCLPYGVQHEDEGVCLLVRMGSHRILLDCGLRDNSLLLSSFPQSSMPADLVLISHAHPDHARGLLDLHGAFPFLPIYASEVTSKLLPLNWLGEEGDKISQVCHALPLRSPVEIQSGLVVELFPSGHLPGAVAFLLTYTDEQRTYKLLYTGDFFLSNSRLVEGLRLEELRGLDLNVLILEGSYGTSRYPHRRQQENQLAERIHTAISSGVSVLLPTPALGLGQELLMLLRSHHYFTGRDLDIWVDGTVADGCDAYLEILHHLPPSVQNFARHQPLFWDERVRPLVRRLRAEERGGVGKQPCIVLTDSASDFRQYYTQNPGKWLILLPDNIQISFDDHDQHLAAFSKESYVLAEHSDGPGTTQLIHNLRPQHVVFIHGSRPYLTDLTGLDELHNRYHLHLPAPGTLVEMPIGETFLQPAAPDTNYEGELTELDTIVTINLPDAITHDPRWHRFADTGLIEARWQGEDLVLRGLSVREILSSTSPRYQSDVQCCGTCRHQRGQRCWNPASPLYNFKVTLEGYCPGFEGGSES